MEAIKSPQHRFHFFIDRKTLKLIKKYKAIYFMMIPVLVYFLVFSYYPLVLGMIQSFQKNKLIGTPDFAGLSNYKAIFKNYQFRQAFVNSFVIGIGTQALTFVLSLILALSINEVRRKFTKEVMQTVTYLPNLFSWTVVGGMWVFILSSNGLVNGLRATLGFTKSIQFLAEEKYAQPIMILTGAWKSVGYYAILFMASIVSIDTSVFEAAQIDGASRIRQITSIIIPELIPTMKVIIVLCTMGLLRNFDQVFIMGNSSILDKVRTLLLFIYTEGITKFQVGTATAAATVVLIATMVVTFIVRKVIRYDEVDD